jgi:hypothetical protein
MSNHNHAPQQSREVPQADASTDASYDGRLIDDKVAERLHSEDRSGLPEFGLGFLDPINHAVSKTKNLFESAANAGRDVHSTAKDLIGRAKEHKEDRFERRAHSELGTTREKQLAAELTDPELTGMKGVRDTINYTVLQTANKIEAAAHAGRDVHAVAKSFMLDAKRNRAVRKLERLERKGGTEDMAGMSLFAFRREKFKKKAQVQRGIVQQRSERHQSHVDSIDKRHTRREEAVTGRTAAYNERFFGLLDRVQNAKQRQAERRLGSQSRLEEEKLTPETRKLIEDRKKILEAAIMKSWESNKKKENV